MLFSHTHSGDTTPRGRREQSNELPCAEYEVQYSYETSCTMLLHSLLSASYSCVYSYSTRAAGDTSSSSYGVRWKFASAQLSTTRTRALYCSSSQRYEYSTSTNKCLRTVQYSTVLQLYE